LKGSVHEKEEKFEIPDQWRINGIITEEEYQKRLKNCKQHTYKTRPLYPRAFFNLFSF